MSALRMGVRCERRDHRRDRHAAKNAPSWRVASQLATSADVGRGFCVLVMARFPRKRSYQGYLDGAIEFYFDE
ncbi:MAG TPA: hypothetical protein EYQ20_02770 [candidate division Zixibacteria bacterium]|nr:hypothetical protein [candidate division Zixibacteria bacterium]